MGAAGRDEETSAAPLACRGSASGILLAVRGFFVNHARKNSNNKQEGLDGGIGKEEEDEDEEMGLQEEGRAVDAGPGRCSR